MTPPPLDPDWEGRVTRAGVPLELWDGDVDDHQFAWIGMTLLQALRQSTLSDEDVYPLLVRYWTGEVPAVEWPPEAAAVARRCAAVLASRSRCTTFLDHPTDVSLNAAREAIITELCLTPAELLSVLADHWETLAPLEMPIEDECTLLAFARHVLLEPVVGACAYIWLTLDTPSVRPDPERTFAWEGWSPMSGEGWASVVAELARFGELAPVVDDADALLASVRARALPADDDAAELAASIVRTSGWPGDTHHIDPLALRAVELARQRANDFDPETDNDEIVDAIQKALMPPDHVLREWIGDPSFGTLVDHTGISRTGADMLHQAGEWLTWSLARAAVDVFIAVREASSADI